MKKCLLQIFAIPLSSRHENVVECPREFIVYFNSLETTCANLTKVLIEKGLNQYRYEFKMAMSPMCTVLYAPASLYAITIRQDRSG